MSPVGSVRAEVRADIEAATLELSASDQAVLGAGSLTAARALGYTPTEYGFQLHAARRRLRQAVVRRRHQFARSEPAAA